MAQAILSDLRKKARGDRSWRREASSHAAPRTGGQSMAENLQAKAMPAAMAARNQSMRLCEPRKRDQARQSHAEAARIGASMVMRLEWARIVGSSAKIQAANRAAAGPARSLDHAAVAKRARSQIQAEEMRRSGRSAA